LTKQFETEKYWDIDEYEPFEGTYEEAKEELDELVKDAVQKRMMADVPVGVFLSGGIDSSLVAAMAQQTSKRNIKTFSIKFQENDFNESQYAQEVATLLKTDHTTIECNYQEAMDVIDDLLDSYQEPFADSSAIPTTLLAKHTRKHVTVALSGDAGDESFLGYEHYDWLKKVRPLYSIPKSLRTIGGKGLSFSNNKRIAAIAKSLHCDNINDLYIQSNSSLATHWMTNPTAGQQSIYNEWGASDKNLLERSSDLDLKIHLTNYINTKVDRATMAHSLEARAPLEDYRIVAFARSLPTDFKYCKGNKKRILKDVLYQYLPKELFNRPKMGFGVPLEHWFRKELKGYLLDTLNFQIFGH